MTINFFSFRFAGFFFKYSTIISLSGDSYCKESACNSPRETKYINIYREREREKEKEREAEHKGVLGQWKYSV